MPSFKGIPAEVEPALDKPLLSMQELLEKQFGKK
jgi:formylmethanofuran dehydrogenase subunit D